MDKIVLIAPLNWGLGHAARCIPIIRAFERKGYKVLLASDGPALLLLQKEFPESSSFKLPSYNISYPFKNAVLNMLFNASSFLKGIRAEKKVLADIVSKENPDLIISDNRYGIKHPDVKSVFVGHQINIKGGNIIFSKLATWFNKKMISSFDELWIPDRRGKDSLCGDLTGEIPGMETQYLGPLSRFHKMDVESEYEFCAVLSGPEPQRSLFEEQITQQLSHLNEKTLIVLGKMDDDRDFMLNENTRIIGHLTAAKLNEKINKSNFVIARAGYSTIMDMICLGKKAILIPTPGQTEQEYLAKHLEANDQFYFQTQNEINIPEAVEFFQHLDSCCQVVNDFDVDDVLI